MRQPDRKAAVAAYKERKVEGGIFTVTCRPSGQVWVGSTPNLEKIENRIWFSLRNNGYPGRSLQKAWNEHAPEDFALSVVERTEEEPDAYLRDSTLRKRLTEWRDKLDAETI